MSLLLRHALAWAVVLPAATTAQAQTPWPPVPALSAHRGASALYPEMTQPAFAQALQDGADLLELDVVLSRDGVPVVRHDAALAAPEVGEGMPFATTDVATRPEFAQRKTTKTVDGVRQTGWFAEDFTLQELKTLRTVERFAQLRPGSAAHDGQHPLLTLQEVADLAKAHTARTGRPAGLLIELKHAAYLQAQGLDLGRALLEFLERNQWSSAQAPVIVQSFEVQVLKELRARSPVRILQLLGGKGGPPDRAAQGATYAQMASAQGMAAIAAYAQGVALPRQLAMAMDKGRWIAPSAATREAKAAGLAVHVWTLRPENQFLPPAYRKGTNPADRGDALAEARAILGSGGVDGLIADDPAAIHDAFRR
ncbi:glycerophosphodiester phosphodiesterase family protein [Acidovorax sp. SDU_ACID1]|uniref:glycerophosphodiester phosphodiesterase family protein n=1 Tax=Acidovorax sp. SDU_ACID1 TaxID=3136632 RepID=UPI0038737D3E